MKAVPDRNVGRNGVHNHDMLVGRRAGIDGACVRECMGGEEVGKHSCKGGMETAKCVQEGSNIGRSVGGDGQEWRRVEDERREESGYVVGSGRKGVCRWHGWRLERDEKRRRQERRREDGCRRIGDVGGGFGCCYCKVQPAPSDRRNQSIDQATDAPSTWRLRL